MDRFKKEAIVNRFPFLRDFFNSDPTDANLIQVRRIDRTLLGWAPKREWVDSMRQQIDDSQQVWFLDSKGEVIEEVKPFEDGHQAGPGGGWRSEEGETVGEALNRAASKVVDGWCEETQEWMGESIPDEDLLDEIAYVLVSHTGYIREGDDSGWAITLYKKPNGFTLSEWLADERSKAAALVNGAVDCLDDQRYFVDLERVAAIFNAAHNWPDVHKCFVAKSGDHLEFYTLNPDDGMLTIHPESGACRVWGVGATVPEAEWEV